ncbi:MAG: GGDEF domain-containing protein [Oleibacter sp.]|nr:GGDEF domain-containing protein [Thalassolituus sp.]
MKQLHIDILRRHLLATSGMAIYSLIYLLSYYLLYDSHSLLGVLLIMAVYYLGHLGSLFFIWKGRARHLAEPSLTMPLMVWAIIYMSVLVFLAPELRSIILMNYLNIMPFGIFGLAWRSMIGVSLFAIVGYMFAIFCARLRGDSHFMFEIEMLTAAAFLMSLLVYALVGREFSVLRNAYALKNNELRRALSRIEELAITDELTGLNNRRYLLKTLEKQRALAMRQNIPFVVAYMDIDQFKNINDVFGHRIGDQVLVEIANLLRISIREIDLAARYGGDEFVLLLSGLEASAALGVLERIRLAVESGTFSEAEVSMTVSIGLAQHHNDEVTDEVLSRADRLLYQAKSEGRNRVVTEPLT